jgi:hypothetical protein
MHKMAAFLCRLTCIIADKNSKVLDQKRYKPIKSRLGDRFAKEVNN